MTVADREPLEAPRPQDQADGTERARRETTAAPAGVSTPRAADQADPEDRGDAASGDDFVNRDAERAADLANDLKSWMDARGGERGEVL
jgi:hypothetical protein